MAIRSPFSSPSPTSALASLQDRSFHPRKVKDRVRSRAPPCPETNRHSWRRSRRNGAAGSSGGRRNRTEFMFVQHINAAKGSYEFSREKTDEKKAMAKCCTKTQGQR